MNKSTDPMTKSAIAIIILSIIWILYAQFQMYINHGDRVITKWEVYTIICSIVLWFIYTLYNLIFGHD